MLGEKRYSIIRICSEGDAHCSYSLFLSVKHHNDSKCEKEGCRNKREFGQIGGFLGARLRWCSEHKGGWDVDVRQVTILLVGRDLISFLTIVVFLWLTSNRMILESDLAKLALSGFVTGVQYGKVTSGDDLAKAVQHLAPCPTLFNVSTREYTRRLYRVHSVAQKIPTALSYPHSSQQIEVEGVESQLRGPFLQAQQMIYGSLLLPTADGSIR